MSTQQPLVEAVESTPNATTGVTFTEHAAGTKKPSHQSGSECSCLVITFV